MDSKYFMPYRDFVKEANKFIIKAKTAKLFFSIQNHLMHQIGLGVPPSEKSNKPFICMIKEQV